MEILRAQASKTYFHWYVSNTVEATRTEFVAQVFVAFREESFAGKIFAFFSFLKKICESLFRKISQMLDSPKFVLAKYQIMLNHCLKSFYEDWISSQFSSSPNE